MSEKDSSQKTRNGAWVWILPAIGAVGVAVSYAYVYQEPVSTRWTIFGTAVGISGAAAIVGGVVGFLFGIPHTVQKAGKKGTFEGNTNLEQVSDWLTKIIVGVGLVQIGKLLPALGRLGRALKVPLGNHPSSPAFALAICISYALMGFLFLYLWSRERLPAQLAASMVANELHATEKARADALDLVNRQLESRKGGKPPTPAELDKAIADAPPSTQELAFAAAERVRSATWEDDKPTMEKTIPVFRALIAADAARSHHRSRGSLGWALKDRTTPEWEAARDELTRAIQIRDAHGVPGWRLYESNRALCDIKLEQGPDNQVNGQLAALTTQIGQDLAAASADSYARQMVRANADIQTWLHDHPGAT